jgi:hypothetical protein
MPHSSQSAGAIVAARFSRSGTAVADAATLAAAARAGRRPAREQPLSVVNGHSVLTGVALHRSRFETAAGLTVRPTTIILFI